MSCALMSLLAVRGCPAACLPARMPSGLLTGLLARLGHSSLALFTFLWLAANVAAALSHGAQENDCCRCDTECRNAVEGCLQQG